MTTLAATLRASMRGAARGARAFSLMEVLVVIALLGILASLVVPNLAGSTAPLPREIGRVLELDLRRARIESIAAVREVQLVVGRQRDRWWLQPSGAIDARRALPSSYRILGSGNLSPYAGFTLGVMLDGATPPSSDVVVCSFNSEGARDAVPVEISLIEPVVAVASDDMRGAADAAEAPVVAMRWRLAPQRSVLEEVGAEVGAEDGAEDGEDESTQNE
jgi:prepilin-type N-terminal cleavage/methylation domain-containing protein